MHLHLYSHSHTHSCPSHRPVRLYFLLLLPLLFSSSIFSFLSVAGIELNSLIRPTPSPSLTSPTTRTRPTPIPTTDAGEDEPSETIQTTTVEERGKQEKYTTTQDMESLMSLPLNPPITSPTPSPLPQSDSSSSSSPHPIESTNIAAAIDGSGVRSTHSASSPSQTPPTQIIEAEDRGEETECTPIGPCQECSAQEMVARMRLQQRRQSHSSCVSNGWKSSVECQVFSSNSSVDSTFDSNRRLIRVYTQLLPCEPDRTPTTLSFWTFQMFCLVLGIGSSYLMLRRRRIVQTQHHRRLDRLANS